MPYPTLRQKLTERNEFFVNGQGAGAQGCDGKDEQWPHLCDPVRVWSDVSLEEINRHLGGWLDREIPSQVIKLPKIYPPNVNGYGAEAARNKKRECMTDWVLNTLLPPANLFVRPILGCHDNFHPQALIEQPQQNNILPSIRPQHKPRIDIFISAAFQPQTAILIGFCKSKQSVTSRELLNPYTNYNSSHIWALRRLAYLCQRSGAFHGFIHTEIELIACQFEFVPGRGFKVEIRAASLHEYGINSLTSNLAMWALTIDAAAKAEKKRLETKPLGGCF